MPVLPPASSDDFVARSLPSALGAEIGGVNLAAGVTDDLFQQIYDAFLKYQVLVFRDQHLTSQQQLRFGQRFGEPQVHVLNQFHDQQYPELYLLTNLNEDGQPDGRHPDPGTLHWHTDGSWTQRRTIATMLCCLDAPCKGGETELADMYGAYEALSEAMRRRVESLSAVHHLNFHKKRRDPSPLTAEQVRNSPPVEHSIVRIHPETGRPTVYLGDMAELIAGMQYGEGRALIEQLNQLITCSEFVYAHQWQVGDLMVWDNRCTLHRSMPYDTASERRVMRRLTILDQPSL
ncbi:MAG: TauD/TfdA family dioxygenase [Fuerstiella sp.]|nr:TauD/TfdA family dioxygenase [Fuerstiella sp.]